jgi:hypothetical protein
MRKSLTWVKKRYFWEASDTADNQTNVYCTQAGVFRTVKTILFFDYIVYLLNNRIVWIVWIARM